MKGDCTSHFLTQYTYYQEFISGGYSIIYLIGYTCSLPSPSIKHERTFYLVENRAEKQKDMLLQGRIWNEISDTNWKNKIVMESYRQNTVRCHKRSTPGNITLKIPSFIKAAFYVQK
jgi:hypothetical protein